MSWVSPQNRKTNVKLDAHPLTKAASNVRSSTAEKENKCKIRCTPFDKSCGKWPDFHRANSKGPLQPRQRKNCEVSETPCRDRLIMTLLPLSLSTSRASSNQRPVLTDRITPVINYSVPRSKHVKRFKRTLFIRTKTQSANFGGNPLYQAAKRDLNNSSVHRSVTQDQTYTIFFYRLGISLSGKRSSTDFIYDIYRVQLIYSVLW